jgi:hypothetical protein
MLEFDTSALRGETPIGLGVFLVETTPPPPAALLNRPCVLGVALPQKYSFYSGLRHVRLLGKRQISGPR